MEQLQIFNNKEFGKVRVVMRDDDTWLVLKDVCDALDLSDTTKVAERLDDDELTRIKLLSGGQVREMYAINESGLYSVVLRSNKPEAKTFKRWITHEVIPTIRKHGAYMTGEALEEALLNPDFLMKLVGQLKEEKEQKELAQAQLEANAPLVLFAETVQASPGSVLIGELSKMLKQRGIDIGQKRLFAWLRDHGFLMRRGEARNQPTQYSMERELLEIKKGTFTDSNGTVHVKTTTKVTSKGQIYFINLFLKEKSIMEASQ